MNSKLMLLVVVIGSLGLGGCMFVRSVKDRQEYSGLVGREAVWEEDRVLVKQEGLKWPLMASKQDTEGSTTLGTVERGTRVKAVDVVLLESVWFSWHYVVARIETGKRAGEKVACQVGMFRAGERGVEKKRN